MCIYIKFRRQLLLFHLCDKKDDINKKKKIPKLSFKRNRKRIKINDTSDTKIPPPAIQRIRKFRSETRTSAPPSSCKQRREIPEPIWIWKVIGADWKQRAQNRRAD